MSEVRHNFKFDKELASSPLTRTRRCTDIFWCGFFILFLVIMLINTIAGLIVGNVTKFFAPIDGESNICGFTPGFEDYQWLYIGNITDAFNTTQNESYYDYGVCIK